MGKIYNLFSQSDQPPRTHSVESANALLPVIIRLTEDTMRQTDHLQLRLQRHQKGSETYDRLVREYDAIVQKWAEKVHRVGALAKGLWLVDFDTGKGFLCWVYPEKQIEHFHTYETGYKQRVKIADLAADLRLSLYERRPATVPAFMAPLSREISSPQPSV